METQQQLMQTGGSQSENRCVIQKQQQPAAERRGAGSLPVGPSKPAQTQHHRPPPPHIQADLFQTSSTSEKTAVQQFTSIY